MVMKNSDVYSMALASDDMELLGKENSETSLPLVPVKVDALCGQEIRGSSFSYLYVALQNIHVVYI